MIRYTADTLKDRALALADLQNSSFLTWSELTHYMNEAYRDVYQDIINIGDTTYLKEVQLVGNGVFDLPDDYYQLVAIVDRFGNEIPRLRLGATDIEYGYKLQNNQIHITNGIQSVIMKYMPVPETITYKAPRQYVSIGIQPSFGFGSIVMATNGASYDVVKQVSYKAADSLGTNRCLGRDAFIVKVNANWNKYALESSGLMGTLGQFPFLLENGSFTNVQPTNVSNASFDTPGVGSSDGYHLFYVYSGHMYYWNRETNTITDLGTYTNMTTAKYVYWNGKHAVVTIGRIIYEDGSYETTDSPSVICLLKADQQSGYGYVCWDGNGYYIDGWTPNTLIDYPSSVFFDLVAYAVAIRLRVKQNADTSGLEREYTKLHKNYFASLSQDANSYPTIRNVNNVQSKYYYY